MPLLTLDIEKPAAGGRMLARHDGRVVLVSGAIPGERIVARVERAERGVAFAATVEVLSASPDRRAVTVDPRCGGNGFAHIQYARQLHLKAQIIQDAFARIARVPLQQLPVVTGSPEYGYRMRARLHVRDGRLGFFLEGTHHVCEAAGTGQLLPETAAWIDEAQRVIAAHGKRGILAVEIAENVPASERACHLDLESGVAPERYRILGEGLVGISAQRADQPDRVWLTGNPVVSDAIAVGGDPSRALRLSRNVRAFFQGNRFLIDELVTRIIAVVPDGPVVDLYAGVGLFGLALAMAGHERVTAVEGDPVAGSDLVRNAAPLPSPVRVIRQSVESYLAGAGASNVGVATVIVDPPRTGLSKEAMGHLVRVRPPRVIYIACDVATLARDTQRLLAEGYEITYLSSIDLFPNTAHVETVAAFGRVGGRRQHAR